MAKIAELNEEAWNAWVSSRPEKVQKLCREFPPDKLYRLGPVGNRVIIKTYCEDGTLTVFVSGEYNSVIFEREVFGVNPYYLKECELPAENEIIGALLGFLVE